MKEILIFIVCAVIFLTIVLAILFHERVRQLKQAFRQAAEARAARKQAEEDEYFKRTSTKNYRKEEKGPQFDKDYFKGTEGKPTDSDRQRQEQQQRQETDRRRTTQAADGVTIIDDRNAQKADRKIFDDSEGEYVEFEEVK